MNDCEGRTFEAWEKAQGPCVYWSQLYCYSNEQVVIRSDSSHSFVLVHPRWTFLNSCGCRCGAGVIYCVIVEHQAKTTWKPCEQPCWKCMHRLDKKRKTWKQMFYMKNFRALNLLSYFSYSSGCTPPPLHSFSLFRAFENYSPRQAGGLQVPITASNPFGP